MKRRLLATMFAVALALTAFAGPVLADDSRCASDMHHNEEAVAHMQESNGVPGMVRAITESC